MSRAGKFIPGGGGNKAKRTGPIRAPDALPGGGGGDAPGGNGGGPRRLLMPKTGFNKKIDKSQKWAIYAMSGFVCALLVSAGWYFLAYLPGQREIAVYKQQLADTIAKQQQEEAQEKQREEDERKKAAAARGALSVDSSPPGATVTVGDSRTTTPAKWTDLTPGSYTLTLHLDGYEDYKKPVTISADTPVDLGTVQLVAMAGSLALTSPQSNVTYTLTGPSGYSHDGAIPDKLDGLPVGDYSLVVTQKDWQLPALPITIHDHDSVAKDVKFPYAKVTIASTPAGATVRQGREVLGQTPLVLPQVRPTTLHLSVDLPPYGIQRIDVPVPDFGNVTKTVTLTHDKDFIAAGGMPMVWIPDGGYWAGKYLFRQADFETVAGYNPSNFRGPNRPVETISWESAQAFIDKLNKFEEHAGKLPAGYHYTLPRESQWEQINADATLDTAATSRTTTLNSTQDVGYSAPNKYGLYDTLGNVWEWCLDDFDDKGDHSLRGGTWLSSPENFTGPETRQGGPPKYADKFIGFRVVLVPNS